MQLLDEENALYIKTSIIPCNKTDAQGDTLNSEDIAKIKINFNKQDSFEVHHEEVPLEGVTLIENYLSTSTETIAGVEIPPKSWNGVIQVRNPEMKERILNDEFNGVSLNNRVKPECQKGIRGQIRYTDLPDAKCVLPIFISFVGPKPEEDINGPSNGVGLHVYDYPAYIQKNDKPIRDDKLTKEDNGVINWLKARLGELETGEPKITKDDKEPVEEPEKPVEEPAPEKEAEKEKEPTVEDEIKELKEVIKELKADIKKIQEELKPKPEKEAEPEVEEKPEKEPEPEKPKIQKHSKKIEKTSQPTTTTNIYEMVGANPVNGKRTQQ